MDGLILMQIIAATLRLATPLAYASIAGTISERSGIIALGLEGMMLMGSFAAVYGTWLTGSPWIGLLSACLAGGFMGLIHAVLSIRYQANQVVSGVGLNVLAAGLTTVFLEVIWQNKGKSDPVISLSDWHLPVISKVPVIGQILGDLNPLVYLLFVVTLLTWLILFKSPIGLRIRAAGEHPEAVDSLGLNPTRIRYACVIICGILAGMGGAFLSIGQLNLFSRGMTAGRGYIAIAACVFGKWNPVGAFLASILFGFTEALQLRMQSVLIPPQFMQMLPYALTLIVLSGFVKKAIPPASLGKPFNQQT